MKVFVVLILLASLGANLLLVGCVFADNNQASIQRLAETCQVDTFGKNSDAILADIGRKYQETAAKTKNLSKGTSIRYYGDVLNEKDWKTIKHVLRPDPSILETLEKYDRFVREVNGKQVFVISED